MTNEIKSLIEKIKDAELKYISDKSIENKKELEYHISQIYEELVRGYADNQDVEQNTYIVSKVLPIEIKYFKKSSYLSYFLLEIPQVRLNKSIWSILKNNNLIVNSTIKPVDYYISPESKGLEKIFKNIVGSDKLNVKFNGINYEDGTATGTDAHKLLHIVSKNKNEPSYNGNFYLYSDIEKDYLKEKKKYADVPNSINEYYELKGNIGQSFPDWKRVIPSGYNFYKEFDLSYLNNILLTLSENKLTNPTTNSFLFEFDTKDGKFHIGFNAKLLSQLCESLIMAGKNMVKFYFSSSSNGVVILNRNLKFPSSNYQDFFMENNFGFIMPIYIGLPKDYSESDLMNYVLLKYNDTYDFDIRIGDSPSYNLIEGENKPNSKKEVKTQAKTESKADLYHRLIEGYELALEIETDKKKIRMYNDLIEGYELALELE